jgi:hypothetical protein
LSGKNENYGKASDPCIICRQIHGSVGLQFKCLYDEIERLKAENKRLFQFEEPGKAMLEIRKIVESFKALKRTPGGMFEAQRKADTRLKGTS